MIYPVFLPHAGCPFQCVYCNQRVTVTGGGQGPIAGFAISRMADYANQVRRSGIPGEIAFYGGTFTALPRALVEEILSAASAWVEQGIFTGVRFSTRPDCLEGDVVEMLSSYPVRTVELGVQSLSDSVLKESGRGYGAESVYGAARRVKGRGWKLGIQLMAGLPGDSREFFLHSVRSALEIGADFLRIYPVLVLEGTSLAESYRAGLYVPLSLDEAVSLLAPAYDLAMRAGVSVIRMGLQADRELEKPGVILAGPYHPAFGSLVKCRWWLEKIDAHLGSLQEFPGSEMVVHVAPNQVSDAIGNRKANLLHWHSRWGIHAKVVGDAGMTGMEITWKTKSSNQDTSL
ncbi:MAG: elongator complex protein 3 [Syntrophobacteraceae bacterium]